MTFPNFSPTIFSNILKLKWQSCRLTCRLRCWMPLNAACVRCKGKKKGSEEPPIGAMLTKLTTNRLFDFELYYILFVITILFDLL